MLNRLLLGIIALIAAMLFVLLAFFYPHSITAIALGAAAFFGALVIIFFIPATSPKQVDGGKDKTQKPPEQAEQLSQQVKELKKAFNGWRAVPGGDRLRNLLMERSRRNHLVKAVELARADRHREAIEHLEACLGPGLTAGDRAAIHLLIGNAHLATGQPVQAEASYQKSLAAAEAIPSTQEKKEAQATALGNLGIVYRQKGELEKALEHYQKALKIHRGIGNRPGEAAALNNLANVLRLKGNLKAALIYYMDALELFRTIRAEREIGLVEKAIAEVQAAMKKQKGTGSSGKG